MNYEEALLELIDHINTDYAQQTYQIQLRAVQIRLHKGD